MKFLRQIYRVWGLLCFSVPMLFFLPLFHIFALRKEWHKYASALNRIWAWIFFTGIFIPVRIKRKSKLKKGQNCVYCINHTSWLDIATLGRVIQDDFIFMGKESLTRLPLFGPMFKKIHVTVDRKSKEDSNRALQACMDAVDLGQSPVIFPEGGIKGNNPPRLNPFKNGAFKIAVKKKIPVVPISILYNWYIFDKTFIPRWHVCEVVIHEPVYPDAYDLDNLEAYKQKVFDIIEEPLKPLYREEVALPEPSIKTE